MHDAADSRPGRGAAPSRCAPVTQANRNCAGATCARVLGRTYDSDFTSRDRPVRHSRLAFFRVRCKVVWPRYSAVMPPHVSSPSQVSRSLIPSRPALVKRLPDAWREALLVAVAYYLGAKVGFAFTFQPHPISTLWLPNSLLLAALLLSPVSSWWVLLAAALPAHLAAELQSGVPPAMVLGWFASNSTEALIGAVCIRRFCAVPLRFDSFRDVGAFLIFGTFLAPLLSSFLDAALVTTIGWGEGDYWQLVQLRFLSNVLAALIVVPFVMTWASGGIAAVRSAPRRRGAEAGALCLCLLAVGVAIFDQEAGPSTVPALLYAPLPFLLWAAVRFGPRGTSTAILGLVLLAIWGATHGQGPFVTSSPEENARSVQFFLIAVSVPVLLLAAALEERRKEIGRAHV